MCVVRVALIHACGVGPLLASHLYESRACSRECEYLFLAREHRACSDHLMIKTLRGKERSSPISHSIGDEMPTRSSITLRI